MKVREERVIRTMEAEGLDYLTAYRVEESRNAVHEARRRKPNGLPVWATRPSWLEAA